MFFIPYCFNEKEHNSVKSFKSLCRTIRKKECVVCYYTGPTMESSSLKQAFQEAFIF